MGVPIGWFFTYSGVSRGRRNRALRRYLKGSRLMQSDKKIFS